MQELRGANNIDGILSQIKNNEDMFRKHRNDGSKLDKFRALVSQSLGFIDKLGTIIAHASKAVSAP